MMLFTKTLNQLNIRQWSAVVIALLMLFAVPASAQSEPAAQEEGSAAVMEAFNQQALEEARAFGLTEQDQHQILFIMGVALLVLLGATAYFGIRMGISGHDVFIPHMLCAGLTITLAIAHAVTSIVWFFPF